MYVCMYVRFLRRGIFSEGIVGKVISLSVLKCSILQITPGISLKRCMAVYSERKSVAFNFVRTDPL
jgi:hypothetical protein